MVTVAFQIAVVGRFEEPVNGEEVSKILLSYLAHLTHELQARIVGV